MFVIIGKINTYLLTTCPPSCLIQGGRFALSMLMLKVKQGAVNTKVREKTLLSFCLFTFFRTAVMRGRSLQELNSSHV